MKSKKKSIYIIVILFLSFGYLYSQVINDSIAYHEEDNLNAVYTKPAYVLQRYEYTPYTRKIPPNFKNNYNSSEFDYTEKNTTTTQNNNNSEPLDFSFIGGFIEIIMYLGLAVVLILLGFFIYKMFTSWRYFSYTKKIQINKGDNEIIKENETDIKENNFQKLIEYAETNEDYRNAYRYRFLWILQKMYEKNIIKWKKDKTNDDYYKEAIKWSNHSLFIKTINIFDYVWYGNFNISKDQYLSYVNITNQIMKQL